MEGFSTPQWRKHNIWSMTFAPNSRKKRCWELNFVCITMWCLRWYVTQLYCVRIKWTAAFLAKTVQHPTTKQAGGGPVWVHIHQTDWDSPHPDAKLNLTGTVHMPTSDIAGELAAKIDGVPPGYVQKHTPHPSAIFFNLDTYAKGCKYDLGFNADLLTDEGTTTG